MAIIRICCLLSTGVKTQIYQAHTQYGQEANLKKSHQITNRGEQCFIQVDKLPHLLFQPQA
jgi:hypothetical protein